MAEEESSSSYIDRVEKALKGLEVAEELYYHQDDLSTCMRKVRW